MTRGLTTGIIYIPLDVRWPRSKKVRAMVVRHGAVGLAAWALYLAMACYCRENLSDGFVPAEEAGAMAYPLPPDQAARLLGLLEDYRLIAPAQGQGLGPGLTEGLDTGLDTGLSDGLSTGLSTGLGPGYIVRAYLKRNPTRADALETAERLAKAGRAGGLTRSSQWVGSDGLSTGLSTGLGTGVAQTETESENPRAGAGTRAGTRPRGDDPGWTPSGVLDRPARSPARSPATTRRGGTRTPPPSQTVLANAHRAGGPTADVTAWAAKARAGITQPEEEPTMADLDRAAGTQPDDPQPPPADTDPEPARQDPQTTTTAEEPAEDEIPF